MYECPDLAVDSHPWRCNCASIQNIYILYARYVLLATRIQLINGCEHVHPQCVIQVSLAQEGSRICNIAVLVLMCNILLFPWELMIEADDFLRQRRRIACLNWKMHN